MTMKKCRDCAAPVSSEAKVCPTCGAPDPAPYPYGVSHLIGILVCASLVYMAWNGDDSKPDTHRETSIPTEQPPGKIGGDDDEGARVLKKEYEHAVNQFGNALKDPAKVAVIECLGVKVYEAPQPEGHPPYPEECARIKAKIEQRAEEMRQADLGSAPTESPMQPFRDAIAASEPSPPVSGASSP